MQHLQRHLRLPIHVRVQSPQVLTHTRTNVNTHVHGFTLCSICSGTSASSFHVRVQSPQVLTHTRANVNTHAHGLTSCSTCSGTSASRSTSAYRKGTVVACSYSREQRGHLGARGGGRVYYVMNGCMCVRCAGVRGTKVARSYSSEQRAHLRTEWCVCITVYAGVHVCWVSSVRLIINDVDLQTPYDSWSPIAPPPHGSNSYRDTWSFSVSFYFSNFLPPPHSPIPPCSPFPQKQKRTHLHSKPHTLASSCCTTTHT